MKLRLCALCTLFASLCSAQLTVDQRLSDFRNLADLFARRYGPGQWKKDALRYDVLDLKPWMPRVSAAKDDLEFYDLMLEYVATLQDAHDQFYLPSDFEAYLGFSADLYDGKLLIDYIDRDVLNPEAFPFQIGDQLISIDGNDAVDLMKLFSKYISGGNSRTTQRFAAGLITDRYQAYYSHAHEVGNTAAVVILRQGGASESYTIPWQKTGTPLTMLGASAGPTASAREQALAITTPGRREPLYQQVLERLRNYTLPDRTAVLGFGELKPIFGLPAKFVPRLGRHSYDSYFTGTYAAPDGTRVGFLRIPDFLYSYMPDLDKEIKYFQANTDVLVVDAMRNPGGDICAVEDTVARLTPNSFQGAMHELRVDWSDVITYNEALADAQANDADPDTIALYQLYHAELANAFLTNQGRSKALPVCGSTPDRTPVGTAYSKPVLLLVDEMSASAADLFAALVQDNHVATLFGYRTMGAGGSPEGDAVGVYSEGGVSVTRTLIKRPQPVVTSDFPTTQYIENVGVRPDVLADYMTAENLLNQGKPFVDAFTEAASKLAKAAR